jgi:Uma2 family endonuclease
MTWDGRMHIDLEPPFLVVKPGMTEQDFYRLADEDSNWEYLDGRIVMHSPASNRHEALFGFLLFLVSGFADVKGAADVRGSRYPMRLDEHWSPEPDLLVVRHARRHLLKEQHVDGPADMVIEIASASDPRLDEREKLPRYRSAGIEEMWFINPFEQVVRVETKLADGYSTRSFPAGRLESVVLPGLWIDVAWLWQEPLPSRLRCLEAILK